MPDQARILIIEDDPDTIQLLQVVLRTGGYLPVQALGGKAGLQLLKENGAELVLLDLMMDDIDGWTVLEQIRQDESLSAVPVIILSVKNPLEDPRRLKAHAGMFDDYVVKPFNVRDLLSRVARALEKGRTSLPAGTTPAADGFAQGQP
ncbi:MAG TPA: response regulator transcription factor [Anaerolineae bacterium]|nr:response regulator transcription factor [Anaerolineae bacterium]